MSMTFAEACRIGPLLVSRFLGQRRGEVGSPAVVPAPPKRVDRNEERRKQYHAEHPGASRVPARGRRYRTREEALEARRAFRREWMRLHRERLRAAQAKRSAALFDPSKRRRIRVRKDADEQTVPR